MAITLVLSLDGWRAGAESTSVGGQVNCILQSLGRWTTEVDVDMGGTSPVSCRRQRKPLFQSIWCCPTSGGSSFPANPWFYFSVTCSTSGVSELSTGNLSGWPLIAISSKRHFPEWQVRALVCLVFLSEDIPKSNKPGVSPFGRTGRASRTQHVFSIAFVTFYDSGRKTFQSQTQWPTNDGRILSHAAKAKQSWTVTWEWKQFSQQHVSNSAFLHMYAQKKHLDSTVSSSLKATFAISHNVSFMFPEWRIQLLISWVRCDVDVCRDEKTNTRVSFTAPFEFWISVCHLNTPARRQKMQTHAVRCYSFRWARNSCSVFHFSICVVLFRIFRKDTENVGTPWKSLMKAQMLQKSEKLHRQQHWNLRSLGFHVGCERTMGARVPRFLAPMFLTKLSNELRHDFLSRH